MKSSACKGWISKIGWGFRDEYYEFSDDSSYNRNFWRIYLPDADGYHHDDRVSKKQLEAVEVDVFYNFVHLLI